MSRCCKRTAVDRVQYYAVMAIGEGKLRTPGKGVSAPLPEVGEGTSDMRTARTVEEEGEKPSFTQAMLSISCRNRRKVDNALAGFP